MRVGQGQVSPVQPRRVGPGSARKIAIIGTAPTHRYAPWDDPSWEIWAHASAWNLCRRADRWFDLHPEARWRERKTYHPDYAGWLATQAAPIYMQQKWKEIPACVRYPKERVLAEFPRYHSGQVSWMIALALLEGVTHLGFFGVHYSMESEYAAQRAGCEFWMGLAFGRGVQLVIPDNVPLLKEPPALYGYEDAAWQAWVAEWKAKRSQTAVIPAVSITPIVGPLPPLPADAPAHAVQSRVDEFWMLRGPAASSVPQPAGVTHE
jgi:hypothetical protein